MHERRGRAEGCVMMKSGSGVVRTWLLLVPSVYPVLTQLLLEVMCISRGSDTLDKDWAVRDGAT